MRATPRMRSGVASDDPPNLSTRMGPHQYSRRAPDIRGARVNWGRVHDRDERPSPRDPDKPSVRGRQGDAPRSGTAALTPARPSPAPEARAPAACLQPQDSVRVQPPRAAEL